MGVVDTLVAKSHPYITGIEVASYPQGPWEWFRQLRWPKPPANLLCKSIIVYVYEKMGSWGYRNQEKGLNFMWLDMHNYVCFLFGLVGGVAYLRKHYEKFELP
jgi:hypothetical protein